MSLDLNRLEIAFALDAVRQASVVVQEVQRELVDHTLEKKDRSPVTVADFASQAVVGKLIATAFPNDPLVGEEDSAQLRADDAADKRAQVAAFVGRHHEGADEDTVCAWIDRGAGESADRFWTLDPIDGTKGFLRGEQYAVALALIVGGEVKLGVLGCPNLANAAEIDLDGPGSLVVAARGEGCWTCPLDGDAADLKQLHVSKQDDPKLARLMRSVESGHTNVGRIDHIVDFMGIEAPPVKMDSQAKYAILASGGGEILFRLLSKSRLDYKERIWDQAAGSIVCEEAGGKITDLEGKPLDFTQGRMLLNNTGVCASNGLQHEAALAALNTTYEQWPLGTI